MTLSRYAKGKELIEFASSLPRAELYEAAGNPYPAKALANALTSTVIEIGHERGVIDESVQFTTEDGNIGNILFNGINDGQRVFVPNLILQPSYEAASAFVADPRTVEAFARLALRSDSELDSIACEMDWWGGKYKPAQPTPYLKLPDDIAPPSTTRGCPAAKHVSPETIKPIWRDFSVFIGEMALRAIVHHREEVRPAFIYEFIETESSEILRPAS